MPCNWCANGWGEYYQFTAGSTFVSADFLQPEVWEDINGYKYAETLYDPGADKFLTKAEYLEMRVADPGFFIVVYMPPAKSG